jgi:hypothetical protein
VGSALTLAVVLGVTSLTVAVEASGPEEPSFHAMYLLLVSLPWSLLDFSLPGVVYGWYAFMMLGALANWALFWGLLSYATQRRVRP